MMIIISFAFSAVILTLVSTLTAKEHVLELDLKPTWERVEVGTIVTWT